MDVFDFAEDKPKRSRGISSGLIWKIGTAYFVLGTLCLVVFFMYTFAYPTNPLNPFPPALGIILDTPIPPPDTQAPPTQTQPLPAATTETPTEGVTIGPLPTVTPFATSDLTPTTTTSVGPPHYKAQDGTPIYLPHSEGCGGLYIAGNVIDIHGNYIYFMIVRVGGTLVGEPLYTEDALSGSNKNYTDSGWEVKIADAPIDSTGTVFVELYMQGLTDRVSDLIIVDTYNDCNRNLIVVNFVQDQ